MEKETYKISYEVELYPGGAKLKTHIEDNLKNPEDVYFCRLSILKALAYFDFPYCGKEECVLKEKVLEVLTKYIRENKPKVIKDKK